MANFHAIAAVSQAIRRMLDDACPRHIPEFEKAQIEFLPQGESGEPVTLGLTVCLYRVVPNTVRRTFPSRPSPDHKRYRPAMTLDLYYLLTPWAANADMQHRMLGWALRTLEDTPILPAGLLNAHGPKAFQSDETVEIVLEGLSLQDMSTLWENVKPKTLLSASYVARMVRIDSTVELVEHPEAQTRSFGMREVVSDDAAFKAP